MARLSYLERYRRDLDRAEPRRRPVQGGDFTEAHRRPQRQAVYDSGFSKGIDPKSLDSFADNPHPKGSWQRAAWFAGWMMGAETFL